MEEAEVPTEHLHEAINEEAEEQKNKKKWTLYVAISTALMAVFAAITSMLAGHHSNEALIEQIKASDQWAYYQAKGIKAEIAAIDPTGKSAAKMQKYTQDQTASQKLAEEHAVLSERHLAKHVTLAKAVTLFQIAIAISAISVITSIRTLWYLSIVLALIGLVYFILELI
jgi:hypothetical protein